MWFVKQRSTNLKFLSQDRSRGNEKRRRATYPIVNFSVVVKSHGGDKIFIIDSYCYLVAIKFNRDPVLFFFYNLHASCDFLFQDASIVYPFTIFVFQLIHRLSVREYSVFRSSLRFDDIRRYFNITTVYLLENML